MKTHDLKTWPIPFRAVWTGSKPYEIRKDDRGFEVGDMLRLREWVPDTENKQGRMHSSQDHTKCSCKDWGDYTGREVFAKVTYKTSGGQWGLPEGLCVLGIEARQMIGANTKEDATQRVTNCWGDVRFLLGNARYVIEQQLEDPYHVKHDINEALTTIEVHHWKPPVREETQAVTIQFEERDAEFLVAIDSDWPVDGVGGCQGRNGVGVKCSIMHKHTGSRHRFCQRQPHEGYCIAACYPDEQR